MENQDIKKPKRSSTYDRREPFYPTPQNQTKLNKYTSDHKEAKISKNSVVNDALSYYFRQVLNV